MINTNANNEFLAKIGNLKGILVSRATNGSASEEEYGNLRRELIEIQPIRDLLPKFVLTCRTIREFWSFMKPKFPTHKKRLDFLQSEFDPILSALEHAQALRGPSSAHLQSSALLHVPKLQPDVVIVTVNEHETRAVHEEFKDATGAEAIPIALDGRTYRNFGTLNGTRVFHALSEMGSSSIGAMQQTVDKAIRALSPGAIVAVGVGFGVNAKKQAIGDILLSKQLRLYDLQRVGSDIVLRDDKPHATARLINHFEGFAQTAWQGAKVRPGVVLTGNKLIDEIDYRNQLLAFEREAVGGEMEGAGLYVSSHEHKVDWIVIKAICDWADGTKSKNKTARQKKAAKNAAQFVVQALQYSPLARQK